VRFSLSTKTAPVSERLESETTERGSGRLGRIAGLGLIGEGQANVRFADLVSVGHGLGGRKEQLGQIYAGQE
jgi:hypothetical protein